MANLPIIYPQQENDFLKAIKETEVNITTSAFRKFEGITVNQNGQVQDIPVIYGLRKITPIRVFASVSKFDSKKLFAVYVIGEGPITKVNRLYIDGNEVPLDLVTSSVIHKPKSGPYQNNFRVEFFNGATTAQTSNLLPDVTGNVGDFVAFNASLINMAYIVCEFKYFDGVPYEREPNIELEICGRKLRNADSIGAEQNVFSNANPADVLLDIMTNDIYGAGIPDSSIDTTSLATMSASFDTQITPYRNANDIARMSVNYIMDTQRTPLAQIQELCRQFDMMVTYANGKYRFTANYADPGDSRFVLEVTESNIIGQWQITNVAVDDKLNAATVIYPDREIGFTQYAQTYSNATFKTADGERTKEEEINLPAITDPYIARNFAQTLVRRSRTANIYTFTMTKVAVQLTVGDILTFQPDGSDQKIVVTEMKINNDMTVDITAIRHEDSYYPEFALLSRVKYNLLDMISITGNIPTEDATVPTEPPPVTPPAEGTGTTTITLSRAETLSNIPQSADIFYRGKFYDANGYANLATADWRAYKEQDLQRLYNISGTTVTSYYNDTRKLFFVEYAPNVTCRYRDTGIDFEGQSANGMLVVGDNKIDKIYYVYPVGVKGDNTPIYGWQNRINYGYETIKFDPESDFAAFRELNGTLQRDQIPIQLAVQGGFSFARFPCPRMNYNISKHFYEGHPEGYQTGLTDTDNITGLRYYLDGFGNRNTNELFYNVLDPSTANIVNGFRLSDYIHNQSRTYSSTNDSNNAVINLKLFCVLDTPLGGVPYYLGEFPINLRPHRLGDGGNPSSNYYNWVKWKPYPRFYFGNTLTGGRI